MIYQNVILYTQLGGNNKIRTVKSIVIYLYTIITFIRRKWHKQLTVLPINFCTENQSILC